MELITQNFVQSFSFWNRLAYLVLDVDLDRSYKYIKNTKKNSLEQEKNNRAESEFDAVNFKYKRLEKSPFSSDIPLETTLKILELIDIQSLFKLGQVCFYLREATGRDRRWKEFVVTQNWTSVFYKSERKIYISNLSLFCYTIMHSIDYKPFLIKIILIR